MNKLMIYTDGGARGNPGPAAIGVFVKDENNKIIAKIHRKIGETTNNVAEYTAVIEALEWLKKYFAIQKSNSQTIEHILFFIDSKLVVNQLNGQFKVKNGSLRELLLKIRILEQEIQKNISYNFVPREKNRDADALVNKALDS